MKLAGLFLTALLIVPALEAQALKESGINFGFGGGTRGEGTYQLIEAGADIRLLPWFFIRNSAFYRIKGDLPSLWGFDISTGFCHLHRQRENLGITVHLSGGYRLANRGKVVPSCEFGFGLASNKITIGLSSRFIIHRAVGSAETDEKMILIVVGTGRVL